MRFCNRITVKALVWLAAILVPVETLPAMACDCGSRSPRSVASKSGRANVAPAAKSPRGPARSQPRHSCCGSAAESPALQGSCCGAKGSSCCCRCCCTGGPRSQGGLCQCSAHKSVPAPDPLPGSSRTENTKSSLCPSSGTMATVAVVVPSPVVAQAAQQPSVLGATSLERLTTLCRLVI